MTDLTLVELMELAQGVKIAADIKGDGQLVQLINDLTYWIQVKDKMIDALVDEAIQKDRQIRQMQEQLDSDQMRVDAADYRDTVNDVITSQYPY